MAHLSGDRHMIEAFREGSDIHAATAAKIYKVPIDAVTADMRRKAKTANFGIIYGISVFGLAERLNIPRSEAKILIDGYFESYPQIKVSKLLGKKAMWKRFAAGNECCPIYIPITASCGDMPNETPLTPRYKGVQPTSSKSL